MMKQFAVLFVILALFASMASATTAVEEFGCESIDCSFNETWTCVYNKCDEIPELVEIENITIVNETIINVTDCTSTDLLEYMLNYSLAIEQNYNYSEQFVNCKISKDNCLEELTSCGDRVSGWVNTCVNRTDVERELRTMRSNITNCQKSMLETEKSAQYKIFYGMGIAAFLIWVFKLRKPEIEGTEIDTVRGSTGYDIKAIESDFRNAQPQSQQASTKPVSKKLKDTDGDDVSAS